MTSSVKGLWDSAAGTEFPVTKLLWGLSIVVFAACVAVDHHLPFTDSFRPSTVLRFGALLVPVLPLEPWRLLSAVFVHANVLHILFNSITLADLGRLMEKEFGSARLAVLFVLAGIFGFWVSSVWNPQGFTLGASGGIFGLIGAIAVLALTRRDAYYRALFGRILVYAVLMVVVAAGIDHAAHAGGFVAGACLAFGFEFERRRHWLDRPMVVLAALALLASVASLVLSNGSMLWKERRAFELLHE
jgi:membrane associated rhomboid family serine protease